MDSMTTINTIYYTSEVIGGHFITSCSGTSPRAVFSEEENQSR